MKIGQKEMYNPPKVEFCFLSAKLNLMTNFSMNANADDWNNGGLLEDDIDDAIDGEDWNYGGGLGVG